VGGVGAPPRGGGGGGGLFSDSRNEEVPLTRRATRAALSDKGRGVTPVHAA
jgi:hypothetical protein